MRDKSRLFDEAVRLLDYDPAWIDAGILTADLAETQLKAFKRVGADPNAEHYRWGIFRASFLGSDEPPTEDEFRLLVQVAESERDKELWNPIIYALSFSNRLTTLLSKPIFLATEWYVRAFFIL